MPPESNPRLLFERMFGAGPHGTRAENARLRMEARRSVLDFVNEDTRRMQSRLDPRDREKLDQYLTGIREVEIRIQKAERFGANVDPDLATPAGIPRSHGEHVRLMYDLLALAFKTPRASRPSPSRTTATTAPSAKSASRRVTMIFLIIRGIRSASRRSRASTAGIPSNSPVSSKTSNPPATSMATPCCTTRGSSTAAATPTPTATRTTTCL
jgi:hypothetical protein